MVGTVVLATRAALNTHRETIEVMHLMGATDGQISRLFERRSAFDGLLGGLMALAAAFLVLAALQARVIATGSGLLGSVGMPAHVWPALADRKSVVSGKRVSVRVDSGCRRIIKKNNKQMNRLALSYNIA